MVSSPSRRPGLPHGRDAGGDHARAGATALSGPEQRFLAQGKQLESLLGQRLPGQDYYFGRLSQSEKQALFGHDVLVNSVALMRLGDLGVLAFASSDPSHFSPHNDTLLLGQLGRLLQLRLPELTRG